jgi:multidrug transporter EmrE-like cation transporter
VTLLGYTVAYVVLSTAGLLLLRSALGGDDAATGVSHVSLLLSNPAFIVGACLYAISFLTWMLALRRFAITTVYPLFIGSGYTAVTLGSLIFLGESLSITGAIGIVLIGAGVVLLVR